MPTITIEDADDAHADRAPPSCGRCRSAGWRSRPPDDLPERRDEARRIAAEVGQQEHRSALDAAGTGDRRTPSAARREAVLARLRDADDLHPRSIAVVQAKALADRILVRPVVLRELLVDDGDARRVGGIGRAERRGPEESAGPSCRSSPRRRWRRERSRCPSPPGTESLPARSSTGSGQSVHRHRTRSARPT